MEKCEAAAKEIRGTTLNRHVFACQLDLASLKSIQEFAEKIKKGWDSKDISRDHKMEKKPMLIKDVSVVLQKSSIWMFW